MFGRQHLPRLCLIVVLGAAAFGASAPAWSQDPATEERLDRLERDLNMLQRQVYGGVPPPPMPGVPPPASAGNTGAAVDIEVRMERLEQQMRDLTGRVEEVGNRVEQLRQRIEQINGDVDMRLGSAPGGPGPSAAGTGTPPPEPLPGRQDLAGLPPGAPPPPPGGPSEPPPTTPPREPQPSDSSGPTPIFGTLQPPGTAPPPGSAPPPPAPAAVPTKPAPPASAAAAPGGAADQQYDYAFSLVRKADYPAAEAALRGFVEHHPNDRLAGSAQYWLGETYYQRGRYLEAASAFAEGYKRYPKGPKAADDLLKLGMALSRANQTQNACLAFGQLPQAFPHAGAAVKERAIAERRRLHC